MPTYAECHIWERQPYDSETGYSHFWTYYVNAPPSERSYLNAYNIYRARHGRPATDILPGNWRLWAQGINRQGKRLPERHTWAERYAAYDEYMAEEKRKALHKKILEDAETWAAMQETALTSERDAADRLYEMAEIMLAAPVFKRSSRVIEGEEGTITQVIVEPNGWKLIDIANVLRMASDLNRRGLLMPRDGVLQEDTWRQTLLNLDMDPDDPESWLELFNE